MKMEGRLVQSMHWCAQRAPLYPSLALGPVTARRCVESCGRDVKANPLDMTRLVVYRVSGKQVGLRRSDCHANKSHEGSMSPVTKESCLDIKYLEVLGYLISLRYVMLVVGRSMYHE
jgi:hypothetical protein